MSETEILTASIIETVIFAKDNVSKASGPSCVELAARHSCFARCITWKTGEDDGSVVVCAFVCNVCCVAGSATEN